MERLLQDVRHGLRLLRQHPGLSLSVIATLALAVGANTAVYSVLHAVLVRPLPYAAPERLVIIRADIEGFTRVGVLSAPELEDLRERAQSFEGFAGIWGTSGALTGDDPEQIPYAWITANGFPLLGIDPILGRGFRIEDDLPQADRVMLIGEELWRRRYAADPATVGRQVELNDQLYTIVGVMPAGLQVPRGAFALELRHYDAWIPQTYWEDRDQRWLGIIGRLKPNVTIGQARAELDVIASDLTRAHSEYRNDEFALTAVPVLGDLVSGATPALMALGGAVAFVLLIACTNVAALLLVRAHSRRNELAVRRALGASRGRLATQLLIESLVLSVAGAVAGLVLARWSLGLLELLRPAQLPRIDQVAIDGPVMAVALGLAVLAGLAAALAPVLQATRTEPGATLRFDLRTTSGGGGARLRSALVVAQLALSLVLLVGAGLMIRTLAAIRDVDPGFQPERVVSLRVPISYQGHEAGEARWQFYQELLDGIRLMPGVERAGGVSILPLAGGLLTGAYAFDADSEAAWGQLPADYRTVTPDYFETIGAHLVAGRAFTSVDSAQRARLVVVDETLAQQAWPNETAIGRRLKILMNESGNDVTEDWAEVIGVVGHIRTDDLRSDGAPQVYRPFWLDNPTTLIVAVRTASDPLAVLGPIRALSQQLGAGRPVHQVRLMDAYVGDALSDTRFVLLLLSAFAGIAVALTTVGLYGLIAFVVSSRTTEIGIRLALGAAPRSMRGLVIRHGLRLALVGLAFGLAAAPLATRAMQSLVFGVDTWDIATYATAALLCLVVAAVACLIPALRASRVDPIIALRTP